MVNRVPSLNLIRVFEAAARHLSFKLAADELCVSPPAVSYQIKSLEEQLGIQLFVRKNKKLELTIAGHDYFTKISPAIRRINTATLALTSNQEKQTLKINSIPVVAQFHLVPYIHELQEQYPELNIQVISDPSNVSFNKEELDIALRRGLGNEPDLVYVPIFDITLTPICSPDFREKNPQADLEQFSNVRLIKQNIDTNNWPTWLKDWGFPLSGHDEMIVSTFQSVLDATRSGLGIGLAYGITIYPAISKGELEILFPDKITQYDTLYMVYSAEHAGHPVFDAFEAWLKNSNALRFPVLSQISDK